MIDSLIRYEILELFRDNVLKRIEANRASIAEIRHEPKPIAHVRSEIPATDNEEGEWKDRKRSRISFLLSEMSELNERLRVVNEWLAELTQER